MTRASNPASQSPSDQSQYLLLLYESSTDSEGLSADDIQTIIRKYSAWSDRLRDAGRLVTSNKLTDGEGRVLRPGTVGKDGRPGEPRVLDGPYSEAKEVVAGFFLVTAADWDEAVEIAESCPHLGYGGTIEVRRIEL